MTDGLLMSKDDITITGMELSGRNVDPTWADQLQEELSDYPGKLHVVMLHGMVSEYGQRRRRNRTSGSAWTGH